MLIKIRSVGKKFEFDEDYVCSVLSFRKVFEELGAPGIAYVAFMSDCDNELYCYLDSDLRDIKARQSTGLTVAQVSTKEIAAAIKEYQSIHLANPYTRMKKAVDESIKKISAHMESKNKNTKLKDDDITSLLKMIEQGPKILESREKMNKLAEQEQNKIGRVKAGATLTLSEERIRNRQQ